VWGDNQTLTRFWFETKKYEVSNEQIDRQAYKCVTFHVVGPSVRIQCTHHRNRFFLAQNDVVDASIVWDFCTVLLFAVVVLGRFPKKSAFLLDGTFLSVARSCKPHQGTPFFVLGRSLGRSLLLVVVLRFPGLVLPWMMDELSEKNSVNLVTYACTTCCCFYVLVLSLRIKQRFSSIYCYITLLPHFLLSCVEKCTV
jgi:hypothetical protein